HCILLALPILASCDPFPLLEFYRWRLCGIRLFCKIEMLWLKRLALCKLPFRCVLARNSRSLRLACCLHLGSIRCFSYLPFIRPFGCLSLRLRLVLLAFLSLISSVGSLNFLRLLPLIGCR